MTLELALRVAAVACLASTCATPECVRLARRFGLLDRPLPPLKAQRAPVAYLGGLAILCALVATVTTSGTPLDSGLLATLVFATLVAALGLADDVFVLRPITKLAGQIGASLVLTRAGMRIESPHAPPLVNEAISILWLCTSMNAVNIVDVSDGLATSLGIAGALGALAVSVVTGDAGGVVLSAALAGALLGFLRFNWQPARIYLGDSGSMLIGGLLGALAFRQSFAGGALRPCLCAIALVAVPIFELGLVVIARARAGVPVYLGSPDHFAVRLRHSGIRPRSIALGALAAGLGVSALACTVHVVRELLLPATVLTLAVASSAMALILRRYPAPSVVVAEESVPEPSSGGRPIGSRDGWPTQAGDAGGARQEI